MLLGWRRNRRETIKVRESMSKVKTTFLWSKANVMRFLGFMWDEIRHTKILQMLEEVS